MHSRGWGLTCAGWGSHPLPRQQPPHAGCWALLLGSTHARQAPPHLHPTPPPSPACQVPRLVHRPCGPGRAASGRRRSCGAPAQPVRGPDCDGQGHARGRRGGPRLRVAPRPGHGRAPTPGILQVRGRRGRGLGCMEGLGKCFTPPPDSGTLDWTDTATPLPPQPPHSRPPKTRDVAAAARWNPEPTDIDWQAELPIGSRGARRHLSPACPWHRVCWQCRQHGAAGSLGPAR